MDAANVFRQVEGFGIPHPRLPQPHEYYATAHRSPPRPQLKHAQRERHDDGENSHRIAHTLTACCRCRQRKTRCDPTLPRCLPCERSGSICEYFDTTKGKKIGRNYVVKLQEKVRALEAELGQYTDEDDLPKNHEDFLRPGGFIRLNDNDETPRYLGPSSGIAMTRLLMEEAKRHTDSKRIAELIPEVRSRDKSVFSLKSRSMSRVGTGSSRKKSFPMVSAVPAQALPTRAIADKLVEIFNQRAQVFTPVIHEKQLSRVFEAVYEGSRDPYDNFVARLVIAISMQKLDSTYAGLADSYYIAAMQYFEDIVRPKDLKTLQCLVLIGQYSLLTPTRTSVYYVIGLATKISQQLGLADEKTIAIGAENEMVLDVRRRVSWSLVTMEFGLAHSMGRPSGFAKTSDVVDVKYFNPSMDSNITENGIMPGPPDEKKLVAIHFCKMRECQAEIRRVLYEKKHAAPQDDRHPWFAMIEARTLGWLNDCPVNPAWCKPWFTGRYHTMVVTIHRPSPQVPRPSVMSATKCFDSSAFVIDISSKQMKSAAVDITWVFLLTLYMALNALLWSVTYPEIRALHPREEVQELVDVSLDIIGQCSERWPGTAAASSLYSTFARACLQSYDSRATPTYTNPSSYNTPPSLTDTYSPPGSEVSNATAASRPNPAPFNPPQFGSVFDSAPEQVPSFNNYDNPFPDHPTFRSNSIFHNPASNDHTGRRFSYFPPDFTQSMEPPLLEESTPPGSESTVSPPMHSPDQNMATPPDSMPQRPLGVSNFGGPLMSTPMMTNAEMAQASPPNIPPVPQQQPLPPMPSHQQPPPQRAQPATFTIPPLPPQHRPQGQQPLPQVTTVTDWFNPPPPFISPYAFGGMSGGFMADPTGVGNMGNMGPTGAAQFAGLPPERQGSLSSDQQAELMKILEDEGMTDIDTYLNMGMGFTDGLGNTGVTGINWNGVQ